ncbi:MAG: hypothetical protein KBS84_04920, partial [Treponema sp.]|nr:hypothetical protein [Candidatus Treponema scatequi]
MIMKKVLFILLASLILFSCGKKKEEVSVEELEDSEESVSVETEEKEEEYTGPDYSEEVYFDKDACDPEKDNPVKTRWVYVNDMDTGAMAIFAYKTNIKLSINPYIKLKTFGIQRRGADVFYFVLLPRYMWKDAKSRYGYINANFASTDPDCFLWEYFKKHDFGNYFAGRQYRSVEKDEYTPSLLYDFNVDGSFSCCVEERGAGAFGTWQEKKGDYFLLRTIAHEEFDGDDEYNGESKDVQVDYRVIDIG